MYNNFLNNLKKFTDLCVILLRTFIKTKTSYLSTATNYQYVFNPVEC